MENRKVEEEKKKQKEIEKKKKRKKTTHTLMHMLCSALVVGET